MTKMRPAEGSLVLYFDEDYKEWVKGYILAYTQPFSHAVIELPDGKIVLTSSETEFRILKDDQK